MHGVRTDNHEMFVVPAEAGIQRLKSLDPGQKHAGMTIKWDSADYYPKSKRLGSNWNGATSTVSIAWKSGCVGLRHMFRSFGTTADGTSNTAV